MFKRGSFRPLGFGVVYLSYIYNIVIIINIIIITIIILYYAKRQCIKTCRLYKM